MQNKGLSDYSCSIQQILLSQTAMISRDPFGSHIDIFVTPMLCRLKLLRFVTLYSSQHIFGK